MDFSLVMVRLGVDDWVVGQDGSGRWISGQHFNGSGTYCRFGLIGIVA